MRKPLSYRLDKEMYVNIRGIPALIYGKKSGCVYLYVHGMKGRKEDAETFALIAENKGFQVLSFDLHGHGERDGNVTPDPFNTLPEIEAVFDFARSKWESVSLYAVSIGAWFSLVSLHDKTLKKALLVSPIVNMKGLIERIMKSANVTPEILRDKKVIPEANLSWEYYKFAAEHEVTKWDCDTKILYPENDNITPRFEIDNFAEKFKCDLCVVPNAEHWLHTERELKFLLDWLKINT